VEGVRHAAHALDRAEVSASREGLHQARHRERSAAEEAWIAAGFPADKAALTAIADAAVVATAGAPP
jgi:hypothetical protein